MAEEPPSHPPAPALSGSGGPSVEATGTLGARVWDFFTRLTRLSAEQASQRDQLKRLTDQVLSLSRDVNQMNGKMANIEARLQDKDKLIEAIIAVKVIEARDTLRAELINRGNAG